MLPFFKWPEYYERECEVCGEMFMDNVDGRCDECMGVNNMKPIRESARLDLEGKSMETNHTPTPWNVGMNAYKGQIHVRAGKEILFTNTWKYEELTRANAAFIVRAVNSHEELLSWAKRYQESLEADGHSEGASQLAEVIAKAEAK